MGNRRGRIIAAEKDELINNKRSPHAYYEMLAGPQDYIEIKGITHFEVYIGEAFEPSSNDAAGWLLKYLK
jgi:hypothetical protein